jgi:hypothetical protein
MHFKQHLKMIKEIVGGFDDETVRQRVAADLARALCPEVKFDADRSAAADPEKNPSNRVNNS